MRVLNFLQKSNQLKRSFLSNRFKVNFCEKNDFNQKILFAQSINNSLYFIFFVVLSFSNVVSDKIIMKLRKSFWHDFIYFFVNKLIFFISKHFFKLCITICNGSQRHLTCLNTHKSKILILPHFDQITRISLKLFCLFDVLFCLLVPLLGFY